MEDVIVGLIAIVVGALIGVRGYIAMRVIIPIWGGFAGFMFGAGLIDAFTDEGFLGSVLAWSVGVAMALVFSLFAYLYYEVSVVLSMGAIGFALGTTATVALGVTWSWVVILVGLIVGAMLAAIAVLGDLPTVLLVVLTALAGASTVVFGLMLLTGVLEIGSLDSAATTKSLDDDWWWYALYVALALFGVIAQFRSVESLRSSLRADWDASGGRQILS